MTLVAERNPFHHKQGVRLPIGPRKVVAECFRCAEDRRKLTPVRIVANGATLGIAALCTACLTALQPLDPDPLSLPEIA